MNPQRRDLTLLPLSQKVLFTAFLGIVGISYLLSVFYLFLVEIDPHRKHGDTTIEAVIEKYYGKRETTKLESVLYGSMSDFVSIEDRDELTAWIQAGATRESYGKVEPILTQSCLSCHGADGESPNLTSFEEVKTLINIDLGVSIRRLAEVSHVHLFGMAFIFLLTGLIFSFCDLRESVKVIVVLTPFLAMLLDIGSWWLTHYYSLFAYTVIGGGALMSLAVPIQVLVPIYQMWKRRREK